MTIKARQENTGKAYHLLTVLARSKLLYTICAVILLGTWNIVAICGWMFLSTTSIAEWVVTGVAAAIVASQFALLYILLVLIPDHIWRWNK